LKTTTEVRIRSPKRTVVKAGGDLIALKSRRGGKRDIYKPWGRGGGLTVEEKGKKNCEKMMSKE